MFRMQEWMAVLKGSFELFLSLVLLLRAYGYDWIEARGAYCRVKTKDEGNRCRDGKRHNERCWRHNERQCKNANKRPTNEQAKQQADHASSKAERERLDQKLIANIAPPRADGHANTDLPGTFCHRDQHNVHDADPSNGQ